MKHMSNVKVHRKTRSGNVNIKICPEDHNSVSWNLSSDDKQWSRGTDCFYPILTQIIDSFSCLPLNISFYIGKTWKGFQKILNTLRSDICEMVTSIEHYRSTCSRRAVVCILSFLRAGMWDIVPTWVKTAKIFICCARKDDLLNHGFYITIHRVHECTTFTGMTRDKRAILSSISRNKKGPTPIDSM